MKPTITITGGKGYNMTFANGYSVSVQFGMGNYCSNRYSGPVDRDGVFHACDNAEVAVFDPEDNMVRLSAHDMVLGYQSADEVAAIIAAVATNPESLRVKKEVYA